MAVPPAWRLLPVASPDIPTLLVSASFSTDSYSVRLTDLVNVFEETMDRREILKRGLVEDTSIDPSDGPDQIGRMLDLIRVAFDTTDDEHPNSSLNIGSEKDGSLLVRVSYLLPQPLKPFRWPMRLTKLPPASLAIKFVLPLVLAHEARLREDKQLKEALHEKDVVINKLVDKLETAGIGLEQVFNALPGKRKASRSAAEERVKGLRPFRDEEFHTESSELQSAPAPADVPALLERVFGGSGLKGKPPLDLEAASLLNDWWTKLGKGRNIVLANRPRATETTTPLASVSAATEDNDDDFQIQATPPRLSATQKRSTNVLPPPADDDETTDGEDLSDTPDSRPPISSSGAGPSRPRLGAVAGRKRPSVSSSPPRTRASPPKPAKPIQQSTYPDSETASEAEDDDLDAMAKAPPPPKPPQRRGGLGRIGGRPNETASATGRDRSTSPVAPSKTSPRKHKLGVIGTVAGAESLGGLEGSGEERRTRETARPAPEKPPPRETSRERADRKRAELQRELEMKAAAGPAKKKRKF